MSSASGTLLAPENQFFLLELKVRLYRSPAVAKRVRTLVLALSREVFNHMETVTYFSSEAAN